MEEDYNTLNISLLHKTKLHLEEFSQEKEEFSELISSADSRAKELINVIEPWYHFYTLSNTIFILLFLETFGLLEGVLKAIKHEDSRQAALNYFSSLTEADSPFTDELSMQDKASYIALQTAFSKNIEAVQLFSESMPQLIERASSGDDESLFNAIFVDRTVLAIPSVAKRISQAELSQDEAFMQQLSKAITKAQPRRPKQKLDDFRYMLEVLDESYGLKQLKQEVIFQVMAEELEVLPVDGKDPFSSFSKLLQRRNKTKSKDVKT